MGKDDVLGGCAIDAELKHVVSKCAQLPECDVLSDHCFFGGLDVIFFFLGHVLLKALLDRLLPELGTAPDRVVLNAHLQEQLVVDPILSLRETVVRLR